jgi:hypothetical protein
VDRSDGAVGSERKLVLPAAKRVIRPGALKTSYRIASDFWVAHAGPRWHKA